MSHSRKHLTRDALNSFPEPTDAERIARVTELRGSNICQIEYDDGEQLLCQIPTRFRKLIWIKRGNYVIVKQPPNVTNYKVRALVEHVLFPDQIKHIKSKNLWPAAFDDAEEALTDNKPPAKSANAAKANAAARRQESAGTDEEEDSDDDADLFVNPNRVTVRDSSSDEDEHDASSDESDEEGSDDSRPVNGAAPKQKDNTEAASDDDSDIERSDSDGEEDSSESGPR